MNRLPRARSPLHVVVVDDVARFALYVWRYLSRCVGFGTGDVPNDGGERCPFWPDNEPKALEVPGYTASVWWINASGTIGGKGWKEQLEAVLDAMGRASNRCFLIDVRGPYHSSKGERPEDPLARAIEILDQRKVDLSRDVLLVSSYHTAPRAFTQFCERPLRIHPKSPETFERLYARLPPRWGADSRNGRAQPQQPSAAIHILVTGAGFEFKDPAQEFLRLGTRPTDSILKTTLSRVFNGRVTQTGASFPRPRKYVAARNPQAAQQAARLKEAAEKLELDSYWDALLMLELLPRRSDNGPAIQREYELREAFRRQFLADDWGFLSQALDALEIPGLAAWLTTNYTRFADRAVELQLAHSPARADRAAEVKLARWRIISTARDAERLLQELLHESGRHEERGINPEEPPGYMFKLHGDLAHLLTMAIAGHDKQIFSPLSLPISSLHSIYTAAEEYLKDYLGNREDRPVFWHIVGHGLKDRLLVRLIRDVCKGTGISRHRFVVVSPSAGRLSSTLRKELRGLAVGKNAILGRKMRADQYLARLSFVGLPEPTSDLDRWSQRLGLPPS